MDLNLPTRSEIVADFFILFQELMDTSIEQRTASNILKMSLQILNTGMRNLKTNPNALILSCIKCNIHLSFYVKATMVKKKYGKSH